METNQNRKECGVKNKLISYQIYNLARMVSEFGSR